LPAFVLHRPRSCADHDGVGVADRAQRVAPARDWGTWLTGVLVAFAAVFVGWVFLHHGSGRRADVIGDAAFLPINLAAALLAVRAARQHRRDDASRRAWMRIGSAYLAWWLGDCLWFYFEVIKHTAPSPSLADIGYLSFYLLLFWGLVSLPSDNRRRPERTKLLLDASTVLVGAALVVWYLVVGPIVHGGHTSLTTTLLSVAYPAGDLVVIFGIALVLIRNPGASFAPAMRVLILAAALFVVADVAYTHLSLNDQYNSGDWPDAFWMVAQVLMVVAAQRHFLAVRNRSEDSTVVQQARSFVIPPTSTVPYLAMAGGYGLLVVVGLRQAVYPLGDLLLGAVVLTGLVVTRQVGALRENVRLLREMHTLAITDSLTGLHTRRSFVDVAAAEVEAAADRSMAVIMIDIDHFKVINDTYGHAAGDAVLQEAASRCRSVLRAGDVLARYGGDEMVALLPGADAAMASAIAERIRTEVASSRVETQFGPVPVSLSLGVAAGVHTGMEELLRRADVALYDAKQSGRDCARTFTLRDYTVPTPTNAPIA